MAQDQTSRQMWIQITNEATQELRLPWMDEAVSFSENGTAQVDQETGERLVDELGAIEPYHGNES